MTEPHLDGILRALDKVQRPGSFVAHGELSSPLPVVEIDGFGPLPLPLHPSTMELLRPYTTQAPYGRGGQTLVDTSVRHTLQIDASALDFSDPLLQQTLEELTRQACRGLGAEGEVIARPYKLLLYETDGFFVPHRDTEKEPGMFATLVVVLPSRFEGGALRVEHGGDSLTLGLRSALTSSLVWAAFYADCTHEVLPVTQGVRAVLILNLVRTQGALRAPDHARELQELVGYLEAWEEEGWPRKLCVVLDHHYTQAELGWGALKGADQARAALLLEAAQRLEFPIHLAMVSIEQSWSAMEIYDRYRHRWEEPGTDEVELHELIEESTRVEHWVDQEDVRTGAPALPLHEDELLPPLALDEEEPDETHYHEATGNEGATFDRTYRRAAVVLWPPGHRAGVVAQGGAAALLAALEEVAGQRPVPLGYALGLARYVGEVVSQGHLNLALQERLLGVLMELDLRDALLDFLQSLARNQRATPETAHVLVRGLAMVDADQARHIAATLVRTHGGHRLEASLVLLERLSSQGAHPQQTWALALQEILALLEGQSTVTGWKARVHSVPAGLLLPLLMVVLRQPEPELVERVRSLSRTHSRLLPFDSHVLPALVGLASQPEGRSPALEAWYAEVRAELEERLAVPLEPPADQRRQPPSTCTCEHCKGLAEFMVHPQRQQWTLSARKDIRSHVESVIRSERLDLSTRTLRQGSPHKLQCTKNRNSYARKVERRRVETEALAVLTRISS